MHICLEREFPQTDISLLVQSLTCYQLSLLMHPLKVFPQTDSRVPSDRFIGSLYQISYRLAIFMHQLKVFPQTDSRGSHR
jgi:hypothetical protein